MEPATVAVDTVIGRRVPHTRPQGFKRLRDDGVPAPTPCAQVQVRSREALAQVEGVVKGAVKSSARLPYRPREQQRTGRDPVRCPHGRGEMGVWRIGHPTYGVIYVEGEVSKRGTDASSAQRAGP